MVLNRTNNSSACQINTTLSASEIVRFRGFSSRFIYLGKIPFLHLTPSLKDMVSNKSPSYLIIHILAGQTKIHQEDIGALGVDEDVGRLQMKVMDVRGQMAS